MTKGSRDIYSETSVSKNYSHISCKKCLNICNGSKVTAA